MPKFPKIGIKNQDLGRKSVAKSDGKKGVKKATRVDQVQATDEVDRLENEITQRPVDTSPLTETMRQGLDQLANKYYVDAQSTQDGVHLMLKERVDGGIDLDKVVSAEVRALNAGRIARDPDLPFDRKSAAQLVDSLTTLFAQESNAGAGKASSASQVADLSGLTAAPESVLTPTLWQGLDQLASKYYMPVDGNAKGAQLQQRAEGKAPAIAVSAQDRSRMADRIVSDPDLPFDKNAAEQLVSSLALLFSR